MFIKSTLTFLILLLSFLSFGQVEKARRVTEVLCSDSLYGRGYVNNGVNKAADFLRDEFEKAGLKPYFGDSSYFQPFSFNVNTDRKSTRLNSSHVRISYAVFCLKK